MLEAIGKCKLIVLDGLGVPLPSARHRPEVCSFDSQIKLAGRKSRVSVEFVEGANRSFASHSGRKTVEQHFANWLVRYFPLAEFNLSTFGAPSLRIAGKQDNFRKLHTAPVNMDCALEGR